MKNSIFGSVRKIAKDAHDGYESSLSEYSSFLIADDMPKFYNFIRGVEKHLSDGAAPTEIPYYIEFAQSVAAAQISFLRNNCLKNIAHIVQRIKKHVTSSPVLGRLVLSHVKLKFEKLIESFKKILSMCYLDISEEPLPPDKKNEIMNIFRQTKFI
eukprot:gnl/Carplike_NY0171/4176_a5652_341.p1 GENE.gnl/Carplike_NY0171/4176_a5652_341~~gnl/Carplike_NY0171/4176_a5652_341.p1  ORF type:complete len:156 (+),score=35.39 gnl/Carplike_NY0171/4176_a5652_341:1-468(+)